MKLTQEEIVGYRKNGYLLLKDVFSVQETGLILKEMFGVIVKDSPGRILEKNGSLRSYFAPERASELFQGLVRSYRLVGPSRQLLGSEVYIHQTKINSKQAMAGDWWEWHQDYTYWKQDDGMPGPDVLTAMIFLNEVNEFNSQLLLIPGSHHAGTVDAEENELDEEKAAAYQQSATYMTALTADLKYTLKQQTVARWAERNGIISAKGPAGSVLFFHGNVFHASANNLSPWNRYTFLVTYNSVGNVLPEMENPRPTFLANRDFTPIEPSEDESWLRHIDATIPVIS